MNRAQLEHAIRAACDVAEDTEVWVFGSQAILGEYPQAPRLLLASMEVDIQPKNKPEAVDLIDGTLGEGSLFDTTHGFYVHGVSLEVARLPMGWQNRVRPVQDEIGTRGNVGLCVEAHDLAVSKLAAHRPKDLDFVRTLLLEKLVSAATLQERIDETDLVAALRDTMTAWLLKTRRLIART